MLSEMIQGLTGSATQCTSTENSEGSPQKERRIVVFVERVTTTTRTDLPAGLPGRRTTLYLSVVTGDQLDVSELHWVEILFYIWSQVLSCVNLTKKLNFLGCLIVPYHLLVHVTWDVS